MEPNPQIVRETRGEWLFHYTTLETALERVLPTMQLRMSPFTAMRDPREYSTWAPAVAGYGDVTNEELDRAQAEATRGVNALKSQFKLLSFTQDDPETQTAGEYGRGYARSRLWELYAGRGRGVCLALHKQTAIDEIVPQLERLGPCRHGSVVYRNQRLSRELFFDLATLLEGRYDEAEETLLRKYMEPLFFAKNTEWSSESEYRFVVRTRDDAAVFVDVRQSLQGLCLGPETPKEYFPALRELCSAANVSVAKLLWSNNDPLLVGIALD